ncbi:MAG: CPXCG motif-containing cysteine-rich protein [Phycisphaerae bacterium]|nr:CPXCG motif-containing cysteine-rich protein [Phycisphaerae bacterium]
MMTTEARYVCENCGETIVTPIDISAGREQEYVEDCPICCHPNVIHVHLDRSGHVDVEGESEDDLSP